MVKGHFILSCWNFMFWLHMNSRRANVLGVQPELKVGTHVCLCTHIGIWSLWVYRLLGEFRCSGLWEPHQGSCYQFYLCIQKARESARPSREQLLWGYEQEENSRGHTRWEDTRDAVIQSREASLNFPDLRLRTQKVHMWKEGQLQPLSNVCSLSPS